MLNIFKRKTNTPSSAEQASMAEREILPQEFLRRIRSIHIRTERLVTDMFAGQYQSAFKGRGMEFEEVREYQSGDDVRNIDWNVTARMGHPYIKEFHEERELTVMLIVDLSYSGLFGTVGRFKNEVAAEVAALLAFSAIRNDDKVGLIVFTNKVEKFLPPKKGKGYVWRVIREVLYHQPQNQETDIGVALEFLNRVCRKRAVCFLISDFLARGYEKALRITQKRHDLISVTITDPREVKLPGVGFIELEDVETGDTILIDTSDLNIRRGFERLTNRETSARDELFSSSEVDHMDIRTDQSYIEPMIRLFRRRDKRRR